jgi:hypothetical protein
MEARKKGARGMAKNPSTQIQGSTIRFSWTDGPTKGQTHEHVFHEDGTVEWHAVEEGAQKKRSAPSAQAERPKYYCVEVTDDFWLVSYLSKAGYTLTVVLNFEDGSLVGIASNDKIWMPVHGHFQVVA